MFFEETWADILARGVLLSAIGLAWVTILIRIVGLRSLSKMTNFDFVMTVALGSVLAYSDTQIDELEKSGVIVAESIPEEYAATQ